MGIDRTEAARRGLSTQLRKKPSEPFVGLEHRVMDSPAFADLKHSSVRVLLAICRQLRKDNNGHLQATFSWCTRYGIGSDHTLTEAIADLIAHGFLYRTKSHGANGVWATYAVTWLPIKKQEGLFTAGFKMNAWREWIAPNENTLPQKLRGSHSRNCGLTGETAAETAGSLTAKTADYESMLPCSSGETERTNHSIPELAGWIRDYVARLVVRGFAENCPVAVCRGEETGIEAEGGFSIENAATDDSACFAGMLSARFPQILSSEASHACC